MPDGNRWDGTASGGSELYINHYTLSLPAADWVLESEDGPYIQNIDVSGVTINDLPLADIDMSLANRTNIGELKNNWALIDNYKPTSDNVITFFCWEEAPTIDLSIKVIVFSGSAAAATYPYAEEASF